MNKNYFGSICLTDLIEQAKKKNEAIAKAENGKIYANVNIWVNSEKDQYNNVGSIQLQKEEGEETIYIGNFKKGATREVSSEDLEI